jgi:hypothetical protein
MDISETFSGQDGTTFHRSCPTSTMNAEGFFNLLENETQDQSEQMGRLGGWHH